jgi:hypothetical protein
MAKVRVKLTHVCNAKEHPGQPGDIVSVEEELAKAWVLRGGCQILGEDEAKPAAGKPAKPAAGKNEDK